MTGYNPDFLGSDIHLPMPNFSPSLVGHVLKRIALRDGRYADYVNFTIVMNRLTRSPIFAALNIDQSLFKGVPRKKDWDIDSRIGANFQLDNDYYSNNPWDRGHLAMRSSAAWGQTKREAKKASDSTFFYSNATLQHENFNQDEWLELENWIRNITLDSNNKITEFTGPIYGDFSRMISPIGRDPAEVPSGFFKVIGFVSQATQKLDVRAFVMFQDREALTDKRGQHFFNAQRYQVTVSEIEELTGLDFDDQIYEMNPLLFNENPDAREDLNIGDFPERIEVDEPEEMIARDEPRDRVASEEIPIFIAAAMVNPAGSERPQEWISIINLSNETVNLDGWILSDMKRSPLKLRDRLNDAQMLLEPGMAVRIQPVEPLMLSNQGGVIALYEDPQESAQPGRRIDRVHYTPEQAQQEGKPIIFAYRNA